MIIAHGHCFRHITFHPPVALLTSGDFPKYIISQTWKVPALLYINKRCLSPRTAKEMTNAITPQWWEQTTHSKGML